MEKDSTPQPERVERQEIVDDPNLFAMIGLLILLSLQWYTTHCTC